MGNATNLQTSFLGGEVAPSFQGRADHPSYRTGMNKSLNGLPLETGSWQRRPGTRTAALTRAGVYARLIDFDFSQNAPYTAEFSNGHVRFFSSYSLVHTYDPETVMSISTATPALVAVNGATVFANGDFVEFTIDASLAPEQGSNLQGVQYLVGSVSGNTFGLYDAVTGLGIDGTTLNFTSGTPALVQRVLDIATPYTTSMIPTLRGVQALNGTTNTLVLLQPKTKPQTITSTDPPQPVFALNAAAFIDGPYMDPIGDGTTVTPSAASGTITLTASTPKFAITDVGRHVRLLSQPAAWASGTGYTTGNLVTYQGAYYVALQASAGATPGADAVNWGVAANASAWVWGIITVFTDSTHVTVALQTTATNNTNLPGVLVNTNAITVWRLGLFSDTTGWPSCGTYQEGRLLLSGVLGNRFDASVSNEIFNFSPTAVDGTVSDANAIAYTFNAQDINTIFWMSPQQSGIVMGTQAAEWLVQASANNDPLTPTNCQAKRISKYGSANLEPVVAPLATLFVARNNKKVFEYLADVFSGKFSGINVSMTGSHLTAPGLAEMRYQKELAPIMWARMNDGTLAGMTYQRESPMQSQQPAFSGWHSHAFGTGRSVVSIATGPSVGGNLDALSMVTYDSVDGLYRVELMTDIFPDTGTNLDAWYVDGGTTPAGSLLGANTLTLYGLHNYEGKTVSAYIAGVDAGDFAVSNGQITINLPAGYNGSGLLTAASIAAASNLSNINPSAMPVTYSIANFPTNPQSLQSYIGPTTPVTGVQTDNILVDAKNNRVFIFKQGNAATDGIRCFDITTGLQINQVTHDQLFGANSNLLFIFSPYAMGYDGRIYTVDGASNAARIYKIDPNTLRILDGAGLDGVSTVPGPTAIPHPGNMAPVRVGGKSFLVMPSLSATVHTIGVAEMTDGSTQNAGHAFVMDEGVGFSCGSYDGNGVAYTVAKQQGTTTAAIGIYKTAISAQASGFNLSRFPTYANPNIVTTKLGTITPAAVDATWTHFTDASSPCYDHSDGHLLCFVQTNDAVTNTSYLLKINSVTAAIVWKIAVVSYPAESFYNMAASYAAFGRFGFLTQSAGQGLYYNVNTVAGTATTTVVTGTGNQTASVWDARLGSVFVNVNFTQAGGSPTLLNATPTSFSSQWARLLLSTGSTPATGRQFYVVPGCVGSTYTSRGQRLRPLEPQETGARTGPALGKTRRNHRMALLLLNTAGLAVGCIIGKLRKAIFKSPGGTAYADNQLYSGIFSSTVEDDNSYDGMNAWEITRPYPATVLSVEGFIETQDR